MIDLLAPPRAAVRSRSPRWPRSVTVALAALIASTALPACGRSGLRTLGEVGADGGVAGHAGAAGGVAGHGGAGGATTGAAGAQVDGGAGTGGSPSTDGSVDGKQAIALGLSPALITLPVGGTGAYTATLTYADGTTADATATATWTSGDRTIAAVAAGRVTALRAGKIVVTASVGALSSSATLVVVGSISLVSIELDPPQATLPIGAVLPFTVTGTFTDGSTADVTSMATFSTDGSGVVTVTAAGLATAAKAGTGTILAAVGALEAKVAVTVTTATVVALTVQPPGATTGVGTTTTFAAVATLSDGTSADVTDAATWATSDGTVATVDAYGVATGKSAGGVAVTATFGGQQGVAMLVVTGATLKAIEVDPVDPTVGVGVMLSFTATGLYSDGTRVDLTSQVTWQSSAPSVLPLDGTGHGVSKSVGTSVVTATMGALTAESTVTVTPASLVTITIAPSSPTLTVGATVALKALGTYSDGSTVDITASVTWTTAGSGIVSVSNAAATAGTVTALKVGGDTVFATLGLVSSKAFVTVSAATLQSIAVNPAMATLPVGATADLTAHGTFSDGSVRDLTNEVAWASSADAMATVANAPGTPGLVTGVKAGNVTITATEGGVVGMASVTVTTAALVSIDVEPANATTTAGLRSSYAATGFYSDGSKTDVTAQVTWGTDDATVATISNVAGAAGQLLARAAGATTVSAALGAVTGTTVVTVTGAAASSLAIAPITPQTPLGTGLQLTATLILTNGTTRNVTGMATWSSSDTTVATISRTGRATPVSVGPATITASYMGLSASTTLTVTDALVVSIQVTPIAPTTPVGATTQFTATAILSDGTTRDVTAMATWVSSAPNVLGVTTNRLRGRGTGVSPGMAVVTATYMGLTGDTIDTVTNAVVVSISVSPAGLTMPVGTRRQFTAQAIRSDGTSIGITGVATWTSDAASIAAVSTSGGTRGQVTALGAGPANITVTYMGVTGSVGVTVTAATLVQVQVTPFNPTLTLHTTLQLVATAIFSDGTNTDVTGQSTWTSTATSVAGVSNAAGTRGLATSLMTKGSTMIEATYMGTTGATTLSVTDATITEVQVTPFNPTIPAGFDVQLTATAIYSDGTNHDVTALATWTATGAAATVSDALATKGLATAAAGGAATIEAELEGVTGTTTLTVTSATLVSIAIAPANPTAAVGGTVAFTATGTFDDMSTVDVTTLVTWTSSDTSVADVSNADGSRGQATVFGSGTTTVQAQRGAVTATTTLTVP
jgi:trimeric autotransporter adhesin